MNNIRTMLQESNINGPTADLPFHRRTKAPLTFFGLGTGKNYTINALKCVGSEFQASLTNYSPNLM